jgi:MinD superfamily P-loop ATPase
LAVVPKNVLVFPELCHSCAGCELVCPENAISWQKKIVGKIEHGIKENIDFYHGLLNIGEIQAIPLLKALKSKIDKKKDVILDSPPGTSCPVIETIIGSDYTILVTEPTPFGLHDLKLAIDVVRYLKIPFGVIINRYGIGNKSVELYCQKEKIPVLLKIPESKKIANLYSKGIALVRDSQEWKEKYRLLFDKIKTEVGK